MILNSEVLANYRKSETWKSSDEFSGDWSLRMGFHDEEFFLPLASGFTFQLKNTSVISYFDPFLLRDGAFFLAGFFAKNPTPQTWNQGKILIPFGLESLVPQAWRRQCGLYQIRRQTPIQIPKKIVFISNQFGPNNFSLSSVAGTDLYQKIKNSSADLFMVANVSMDGQDQLVREKLIAASNQENRKFFDSLGRHPQILNFSELEIMKLQDTWLVHLNSAEIYYSNSAVDQMIFNKGGDVYNSFRNQKSLRGSDQINLGPYHELVLQESPAFEQASIFDDVIQKNLTEFPSIFHSSPSYFSDKLKASKEKIYSEGFLDMVISLFSSNNSRDQG